MASPPSTPTARTASARANGAAANGGCSVSPKHAAENGHGLLAFDLDGGSAPRTPVRSRGSSGNVLLQDSVVRTAARSLVMIGIWYFFSTLLSVYNKLLIGKEHGLQDRGPFPAPLMFASVQFFCQAVLARAFLWLGLVKRQQTEQLPWDEYLRTIVPNGACTGLDIGLSIFSLRFITLSFYTMCKATSPLFLMVFAIAWGLEQLSWSLAAVVGTITPGLVLLVHGEPKFDLAGFALVMTASACSGLRWTYTQVQLQGGGAHGGGRTGGPVEVLAQVTPVASVTAGLLSLAFERLWVTLPASSYFADLASVGLSFALIAGGGLIAFLMVWAEFQVIAFTSALTLMVAGTFKEILTVVAGVLFFGDTFTAVNGLGVVVVTAGCVLYNVHKYRRLKAGALPAARHHHGHGRKHDALDLEERLPLTAGGRGGAGALLGSELILKRRLEAEAELEKE